MAGEKQETYTIILEKEEDVEHKQLVNIFEKYFKLIHYDAEFAMRHSWGFIATKITKTEANSLQEICSANGINTLVIPDASIAVLSPPKHCVSIDCQPDVLKYTLKTKESDSISWDDIFVVSAAVIPEEKVSTKKEKAKPSAFAQITKGLTLVTMGMPISFGEKKEVTKVTKESIRVVYLELFFNKPPYRIQINGNDFNYAYLKNRREYSAMPNFYIMIEDINSFAKNARKNSGFTKMLKKEMLSQQRYDSYEYFEKESRWLVTLYSFGLHCRPDTF